MQLIVRHGDAVGRARAGQTHDVLRADVRGKDRSPDQKPRQMAAGEKVVLRGILLLHDDPPCQTKNDRKVSTENDPVERFHTATFLENELPTNEKSPQPFRLPGVEVR